MTRKTTVVGEGAREGGRRSVAGRARDARGRLLPRVPPEPQPDPGPGLPPEPAPNGPPAPFSEARRPWNPLRRRANP